MNCLLAIILMLFTFNNGAHALPVCVGYFNSTTLMPTGLVLYSHNLAGAN
jgi:uncharacterized integral membrane protein